MQQPKLSELVKIIERCEGSSGVALTASDFEKVEAYESFASVGLKKLSVLAGEGGEARAFGKDGREIETLKDMLEFAFANGDIVGEGELSKIQMDFQVIVKSSDAWPGEPENTYEDGMHSSYVDDSSDSD